MNYNYNYDMKLSQGSLFCVSHSSADSTDLLRQKLFNSRKVGIVVRVDEPIIYFDTAAS